MLLSTNSSHALSSVSDLGLLFRVTCSVARLTVVSLGSSFVVMTLMMVTMVVWKLSIMVVRWTLLISRLCLCGLTWLSSMCALLGKLECTGSLFYECGPCVTTVSSDSGLTVALGSCFYSCLNAMTGLLLTECSLICRVCMLVTRCTERYPGFVRQWPELTAIALASLVPILC